MKFSGLLIVIAIVVVGYCMYNSVVVNPADVVADVTNFPKGGTSRKGCDGPFGVDSQKILNKGTDDAYRYGLVLDFEYYIDIVSKIDLEKNRDGTWYIDNCELSPPIPLYFSPPYPQQNDFKVGDIIGFKAVQNNQGRGINSFRSGKMLENISSQSLSCKVADIKGLSIPSKTIPTWASEKDFVDVTGVIMAVQTIKNSDPEPEDPSDYKIRRAVMKCADGNLYSVSFHYEYLVMQQDYSFKSFPLERPIQEAFGEGDVITIRQIDSLFLNGRDAVPTFSAYYKSNRSK